MQDGRERFHVPVVDPVLIDAAVTELDRQTTPDRSVKYCVGPLRSAQHGQHARLPR